MTAMMTDNAKDRVHLNIFRMIGAMIMGVASNVVIIPLVKIFGNGNETDPRGWTLTFLMLGITAMCLFLLCFLGTKERIQTTAKAAEQDSFIKALPMLFRNKFWLICLGTSFISGMTTGSLGINPYIAQYFLGNVELVGILSALVFAPVLLGFTVASPIISRIGKRNFIMWGLIISTAGYLVSAVNPYSFTVIAAGAVIRGLGLFPMLSCNFAMLADVTEYHEWKFGVRSEGIVYSAASFGIKLGTGLGAAMLGWALALGHFNADLSVQPQSVMSALIIVFVWIPAALQAGCIAMLTRYKLDKMYPQIMADLAERAASVRGK
jgi:GPH family glycoside/pentoside/hexuronide:cation symporter